MTLTEEQRAALKRVAAYMDEMYSVASPYHGCTEDANLLRAMIDSSGTAEPTGGFDLERARGLRDFLQDDCAEVGDVWGEMIAEIERLRAIIDKPLEGRVWKIDLDTLNTSPDDAEFNMARRWHAAYRKAQNSNLLRKQEIERLRPYEKVAADLQACGSYVGIGPGEGDLPISERVRRCVNRLKETQHEYEQKLITKDARIQELKDDLETAKASLRFDKEEIERLRAEISEQKGMIWKTQQVKKEQAARIAELEADLEQSEICIRARMDVIDQQAAQIKSLEDALAEERARGNHYGMSYEDAVGDGEFERWIIDGEKDLPKFYLDRVRAEARRQLKEEGKIGPDAAKPRSWQITEERKAAIDRGLQFLEWSYAKNSAHDTKEQIAVLWAMLDEDTHGKP